MPLLRHPLSPGFPWPTAVLITLNIVAYLVVVLSGGGFMDIRTQSLSDWGGNLAVLSLTGDYWRLLSSMFLHGGLLHLVANMYMLMIVGPLTERRMGRAGMLTVYLIGGLWASYASAAWNASHLFEPTLRYGPTGVYTANVVNLVVSVGASGAIMALCGGLLASALVSRIHTPQANRHLFQSLLQVVGINIVLGLMVPGIDQLAHLGGLIAGFALGLAVGSLKSGASNAQAMARCLVSAALGLTLLAAILTQVGWDDAQAVRTQMEREARR